MSNEIKISVFRRIFNFFLTGATILGGHLAHADELVIAVRDLSKDGISPDLVIQEFQNQHGIMLDIDSVLKVSRNEEGSSIKFEALDHISIVVPHDIARGAFNKAT